MSQERGGKEGESTGWGQVAGANRPCPSSPGEAQAPTDVPNMAREEQGDERRQGSASGRCQHTDRAPPAQVTRSLAFLGIVGHTKTTRTDRTITWGKGQPYGQKAMAVKWGFPCALLGNTGVRSPEREFPKWLPNTSVG